jgi:hypothetical protein
MNRTGFADVGFAMIHGDYYRREDKANEHRRPVLVQAWLAEFVDVISNEVLFNGEYGTSRNTNLYETIQKLGAVDILKKNIDQLHSYPTYFVKIKNAEKRKEAQTEFVKILHAVRKQRNDGTHQKIDNSDFLKAMLDQMIQFCQLLLDHKMGTRISNDFMDQCISELAYMNDENHLY